MIRFLQQDNKLVKILFGVIIGGACISMVIYLVPGLMDPTTGSDPAVYATVRAPGTLGRLFGETTPIKTEDVAKLAERQMQQQHYPASTMQALMPYVMPQAAQVLVQRAILEQEAHKLHLDASDEDIRRALKDRYGQVFFPNGKFIGEEAYTALLTSYGLSIKDFEDSVRSEIEIDRLQALVTGGVTVSNDAVRTAYIAQATKVKFDYAVVSSEDVKKTINPSDADLQTFFKQNAARYAQAIAETRKIEYVAFDGSKIPGGKPPVTDAEIESYYAAHQADYKTEEEVKTRHILISSKAGADAQADGAAKAKAQDVLKQVLAGGNFADLAKKYSEDPGSKDAGGELPLMPTAQLDPAYAKAAMALGTGQTSGLVRSSFGYHIIQTEQKQAAGEKPLAEVKDSIVQTLQQQKQGAAEQAFAQALAAEAKKDGLDKMAAANGLHAVTTDYVARDGVVGGLSDASALLTQAFATEKGAAPGTVATGDGMAVFSVLDVKTAHAPEFAAYKDHILDDYRQEQAPRLLQQETAKLAERAKALGDLKKAAAELKAPVKSSDLVGQDGQVPDIGSMSGPGAVAFTLAQGAISGPINAGQNGVVLTVTDKEAPSAADIAQHMDETREHLLGDSRDEIFRVFLGTLSENYEKGGGVKYTKQASSTPGPLGAPGGQ
ncbi:MAG: peptidyl-prolyl cis-trans isomerase [Acidobacteriaceae bacterium]|jgi:peptidyl-prolyl cis-trans isomerase D